MERLMRPISTCSCPAWPAQVRRRDVEPWTGSFLPAVESGRFAAEKFDGVHGQARGCLSLEFTMKLNRWLMSGSAACILLANTAGARAFDPSSPYGVVAFVPGPIRWD